MINKRKTSLNNYQHRGPDKSIVSKEDDTEAK